MNWIEEMKAGMQMIKSACKKNTGFCNDCPYGEYCILEEEGFYPAKWDLEEKEDENEY